MSSPSRKPDTAVLEPLLEQARQWCRLERGRQSRLAREVGVTRHCVSEWLRRKNPRTPTGPQVLRLQAFLKQDQTTASATESGAGDPQDPAINAPKRPAGTITVTFVKAPAPPCPPFELD